MGLSIGIGIFPVEMRTSIWDAIDCVKAAETAGFKSAWIGDSHIIWREVYATLALCAANTKTIKLCTGVTQPFTRHPQLTCRAILTIDEISHGRAILGIGAGDTSIKSIGVLPASVSKMKEVIELIRKLSAGESISIEGKDFAGKPRHYDVKLTGIGPRKPIPIYLAANGPKMLRLAGQVADGFVASVGATKELIQWALENVKEGAEESGRDFKSIVKVFQAGCSVSSDGAKAKDEAKTHVARRPIAALPRELTGFTDEDVSRAKDAYYFVEHMLPDAKHSRPIPDEWVDKFAVAGTPQEVAEHLKVFERAGADEVFILPTVKSSLDLIHTFQDKVIPNFN
jgi:5,10-methylenetetrahydromethanopterin reductase